MKTKNILIILGIIILIVVSFFISGTKEVKENMLGINYDVEGHETTLNYDTENPVVAMYIKNYGSIVIELYPEIAPNTVNNFISLIKSGFYDNNTFHRLMPGFVLQGGDPTGTGTGDPGYKIKGEFTANGFSNNLSHDKWVVSMARGSYSMDSAGSQFFICLDAAKFLDEQYASFGKVIDGFENIENIVKREVVADSESGQLQNNLVLVKALVDLGGKEYPDVIRMD